MASTAHLYALAMTSPGVVTLASTGSGGTTGDTGDADEGALWVLILAGGAVILVALAIGILLTRKGGRGAASKRDGGGSDPGPR